MSRYISDQNRVGFRFESGTYANPTGTTLQWLGLIQDHTPDESTNVQPIRYIGGGTRDVDTFVDGPLDYTGTITYFPQDWKFVGYALGSIVTTSGTAQVGNYQHTLIGINSASGNAFTSGLKKPFMSFTIYDSHKTSDSLNFNREFVGGMVQSINISASQGDIISNEINYVAQSMNFNSGTQTAVTAATNRPFLWQDATIHIPSGTIINNVKEFSVSINNNTEPPHYLNGSRVIDVPIQLNRDIELTLTLDSDDATTKTFYDQYFIGGSSFNAMVYIKDASATGSRDFSLVFSGCKIIDMENPTLMEGADEQTITIQPLNVIGVVNDRIALYNPWV